MRSTSIAIAAFLLVILYLVSVSVSRADGPIYLTNFDWQLVVLVLVVASVYTLEVMRVQRRQIRRERAALNHASAGVGVGAIRGGTVQYRDNRMVIYRMGVVAILIVVIYFFVIGELRF